MLHVSLMGVMGRVAGAFALRRGQQNSQAPKGGGAPEAEPPSEGNRPELDSTDPPPLRKGGVQPQDLNIGGTPPLRKGLLHGGL